MIETHVVDPDPKRMIEGLRDTGYSFNTAIADLIDNSIAASAKNMNILIEMDFAGGIKMMIADDGVGMNKAELITAMKYGSPQRPNPRSLGKFGLGMKTASTAFCKRLSVISRRHPKDAAVKATWDLDHVSKTSKWELLISDPTKKELEILNLVSAGKTGTLLAWEKVDRLLKEYLDPGGKPAQNAFKKLIEELEEHVGMVYQRFLSPKDKREQQKVNISINKVPVNPWDPFCEDIVEPAQKETMKVEQDGKKKLGKFTVRAFILPRKEENPQVAEKAKISNDRQGFYIYRENRLIHHGDWMGMYTQEPHFSLLRVEFSFNSELDDAFQVDIKKSRISLSNELYRWTKDDFLPPVRRAAEDRYRKGQKKSVAKATIGAHDGSNQNIGSKEKDIQQAFIKIINADEGEVRITNNEGTSRIKLTIETHPQKPGEFFVQPVDSIDDGLLWQPALIEGRQAVQINKGHVYYRKVYLPNILNRDAPVGTIQGMDALLWALAIAELKTVNQSTREHFDQLRYEVSRILRKVVETLPEPTENDNNAT